jgi:diguanylate cyclase (GGDEF)-like protein
VLGLDFSPRGWGRVILWVVGGTVLAMTAALVLDSFNFGAYTPAQLIRSVITDLGLPAVIAPPLLFFLSFKLRELAIAHHKLAIFASTDSLTEVLNRGAFTTLVDAYLNDVRLRQQGGALLVVDVDNFKRINDSFGHDRGDEALRLIAATIRGALRSVDLVGRLGGEEFGIFLPGSTPKRAELAAERIRTAISETEFVADEIRSGLSVSVGGAIFEREVGFKELYRAADQRLYAAKQSGRNRVILTTVSGIARAA